MQAFDHKPLKVLITGSSGTGKTTLWQKLIQADKARTKFVFDHSGEFSHRFGKPPVFDIQGLAQCCVGGYVVFDPIRLFPGRTDEGFAFYTDFVLQAGDVIKGRKLFCCDELQKLTGTRAEPEELLALLDTGRRYQIDVYAISQAPNRIHNGIRNQLTRVYTFRQSDANAVKYLEENGFDADAVRNLARGEYLWRDLDSGESGQGGKAF